MHVKTGLVFFLHIRQNGQFFTRIIYLVLHITTVTDSPFSAQIMLGNSCFWRKFTPCFFGSKIFLTDFIHIYYCYCCYSDQSTITQDKKNTEKTNSLSFVNGICFCQKFFELEPKKKINTPLAPIQFSIRGSWGATSLIFP